jgi:hypothetical protein
MKAYIFMCNWETYKECLSRNLFGVSQNYVHDIQNGDLCYLYQYDLKLLYGVWAATSQCGWHEKEAWGGKYKYQVRVKRISENIIQIPFSNVQHLIEHSGAMIFKLDEVKVQELSRCFESGKVANTPGAP